MKRSGPASVRNFGGGPGTRDPGQITCTSASINDLLAQAYGVEFFQISGPGWLGSESDRYDLHAKIAPGITKSQANVMMQNLLAERFHLALHHESKEFPGYELVVSKGGPKFKESVVASAAPTTAQPDLLVVDKESFPQLPAGQSGMSLRSETGQARVTARRQSLADLADLLHGSAGRPVIDKTGLTGNYDFYLHFAWGLGTADASPESPPSIFVALEQQLGLKLESKKLPFDVLVIDHIEKIPTEN